MSDDKSVLSLADYRNKDTEERKKFFLEQLKDLQEAIESDNISNFLLEWEREIPDGEETRVEGVFLFWNPENDLDVAIGKCERIKNRLVLLAEGLIGSD